MVESLYQILFLIHILTVFVCLFLCPSAAQTGDPYTQAVRLLSYERQVCHRDSLPPARLGDLSKGCGILECAPFTVSFLFISRVSIAYFIFM